MGYGVVALRAFVYGCRPVERDVSFLTVFGMLTLVTGMWFMVWQLGR